MATFNATAFQELINKIGSTSQIVNSHLSQISSHAGWASENYESEDSRLGQVFSNLQNTASQLNTKFETCFQSLQEALETYMNETIENEKTASYNVSGEIDELNDILNGLK